MPRSPEPARQKLLDAALRLWAERGVAGTSLREIRLSAGQRNSGALQYHFGDREGVLRALLEREIPWLQQRRAVLLREANDLRSSAAVFVLPFAELATGDEHQRQVVQFLSQLHDDVSRSLADVVALLGPTGSADAYALVQQHFGSLDEDLLAERVRIAIGSFLHACAMRARSGRSRATADDGPFRQNIVDMFVGAVAGKC